jgi:hypothetical protein
MFLGLIFSLVLPRGVAADYGPLQTVNRFPLHMMFLTPKPISVELPPPAGLDTDVSLDYSNTFFNHSSSRWDVLIDMEMAVLGIDAAYGLGSRWAVRLDLPVVSMSDGFLDGFLENFHDTLKVGNYDREKRPKNQFAYRAAKSGETWFEGRPEKFELADSTLSVQYAVLQPKLERPFATSLLVSLKLPVGDSETGLGSGNIDMGLFFPSQWKTGKWTLYGMPGYIVVGNPKGDNPDVAARDVYSLFVGIAYDAGDRWTWLLQVDAYSTPLEFTGIGELDDGAVDLSLGFRYRLARNWLFEFSFTEDLTRTAPDFKGRLALRWLFSTDSSPARTSLRQTIFDEKDKKKH